MGIDLKKNTEGDEPKKESKINLIKNTDQSSDFGDSKNVFKNKGEVLDPGQQKEQKLSLEKSNAPLKEKEKKLVLGKSSELEKAPVMGSDKKEIKKNTSSSAGSGKTQTTKGGSGKWIAAAIVLIAVVALIYSVNVKDDKPIKGDNEKGQTQNQGNGNTEDTKTRGQIKDTNNTTIQIKVDTNKTSGQTGKEIDPNKQSINYNEIASFVPGSTLLTNKSKSNLNKLIKQLKGNKNLNAVITGYTDNKGSDNLNKKISEKRAKTVYNYLVRRGIDPARLEYSGAGSSNPISDNNMSEGRAKNRRVSIDIK